MKDKCMLLPTNLNANKKRKKKKTLIIAKMQGKDENSNMP